MLWIYGLSALCLLVCLPMFMIYKQKLRYRLAAAYKTAGTLCAAGMALIAAIRLDPQCWICCAGLTIYAAADCLMEFHLYWGAGFFVAGHVCMIAFFTRLYPVTGVHLICALCLLGIAAFLLYRWRKPIGKQMSLFAVYSAVLAVMSACAVAGLTAQTLQGQLIAVGGALFFLSDVLLCARILFRATRSVEWFIMILYYGALLCIGISCLV